MDEEIKIVFRNVGERVVMEVHMPRDVSNNAGQACFALAKRGHTARELKKHKWASGFGIIYGELPKKT